MKKMTAVLLAVVLLCVSCTTTGSRTWYESGQIATENHSTSVVGTIDDVAATVMAVPLALLIGVAAIVFYDPWCHGPGYRYWP
jgi:hypothetical protein